MKTLPRKLVAVMATIDRIPKRGRNEYHAYDYATEADVSDHLRDAFKAHGLVLLPEVVEVSVREVGTKGRVLTTATMRVTILDSESGETWTGQWAGSGVDAEDKGLYKAMTGGIKYWLMKTFLIPTGDDPEREDRHTEPLVADPRPDRPRPTAATAVHTLGTERMTVDSLEKSTGASKRGPWTRWRVQFLDSHGGERWASVFDERIGAILESAKATGGEVLVTLEQKDKFTNVIEAAPAPLEGQPF